MALEIRRQCQDISQPVPTICRSSRKSLLICDIVYEGNEVKALVPREFAAFNDCLIRRPGARKISEKKKLGPREQGHFDLRELPLSGLEAGCELDHFHIASFLLRNGDCQAYGQDSPAVEYSYSTNVCSTGSSGR